MRLRQVLPTRFALVLTFSILFLAWLPIEGNIVLVVGFGWLTTAILVVHLIGRLIGNLLLAIWAWVVTWVGIGTLIGGLAPWIILSLMVLKTGVHSHGPEYTPAEIMWVSGQWLNWLLLGGGLGFGLGLLLAGWIGWRQEGTPTYHV